MLQIFKERNLFIELQWDDLSKDICSGNTLEIDNDGGEQVFVSSAVK